jgi:hypothetical protein
MKYYVYRGRHVVSATEEESDGLVSVDWVAFAPSVMDRRGRRPKFATAVKVSDLEPTEWTPEETSGDSAQDSTDVAE